LHSRRTLMIVLIRLACKAAIGHQRNEMNRNEVSAEICL
jgi:hypothetical protein